MLLLGSEGFSDAAAVAAVAGGLSALRCLDLSLSRVGAAGLAALDHLGPRLECICADHLEGPEDWALTAAVDAYDAVAAGRAHGRSALEAFLADWTRPAPPGAGLWRDADS